MKNFILLILATAILCSCGSKSVEIELIGGETFTYEFKGEYSQNDTKSMGSMTRVAFESAFNGLATSSEELTLEEKLEVTPVILKKLAKSGKTGLVKGFATALSIVQWAANSDLVNDLQDQANQILEE